jgi:hypothetical protein
MFMYFMRNAVIFAFALTLAAALPAHAELSVSMHDGLVSVNATDVTVRQILAEWARVGQTKIVNGEGVAGGPVTLQITDVPEEQALDILLRTASGYLAAPRSVPVANASRFDRILVMPTSAPSRSSASPAPPLAQAQRPATFQFDRDPDDPPVNGRPAPPPAPPLSQQPGFAPVAGSPQLAPPLAAPPAAAPTAVPVIGSGVPGIIAPAAQPGQPLPPQGRF